MKTLKTLAMALVLLVAGATANAAKNHEQKNLNKDEVINTYVNAITKGDLTGLDNAIDDNAQFNMKRGDAVNTANKQQMMEYIKSVPAIGSDCKCTNTVVKDEGDGSAVIKVEIKYNDVVRTNVITVERKFGSWKITNVDTSFKQA